MTNINYANLRYVVRREGAEPITFFSPGNLGFHISKLAEREKPGLKIEVEILDTPFGPLG